MEDDERQHLLGEIAKRDAEIAVLKQTIDALCRRVFGKSSEQLDPAQLEPFTRPEKRPPPVPQTTDRRLKNRNAATRAARSRVRRASPNTCPSSSRCFIRPRCWPPRTSGGRIGEEVREQLDYKPGRFLRVRLIRGKYVRKGDPLAKPVVAPLPLSLLDRCIATPG